MKGKMMQHLNGLCDFLASHEIRTLNGQIFHSYKSSKN